MRRSGTADEARGSPGTVARVRASEIRTRPSAAPPCSRRRRGVRPAAVPVLVALLAAIALAFVTVAPVGASTAAAGDAGGKVRQVPETVPSDCSVDVTQKLATFIAHAPRGSTVVLAEDGCYRLDGSLIIYQRKDLTIDGNGATLKAMTPGDRNRRHVWIRGGKNLTIRDLTVQGANPNADDVEESYVGQKAFQHGFAIQGVDKATLDRVTVNAVYGDAVYIGSDGSDATWSRDITITNSSFEGAGRQGFAVVAGKRIVFDRNRLANAGQSLIDLEANSAEGGAVDVRITRNTTGAAKHFWLANKGAGLEIRDIVVKDNKATEATAGLVFVYGPLTGYRGPYAFIGNEFMITDRVADEGSQGAFFLSRAKDVTIRDNRVVLPSGKNMPVVENRDSLDLTIEGNRFVNAGQELIVTQRKGASPATTPATTPTTTAATRPGTTAR